MQRLRNRLLHALWGNVTYSAPRDNGRVALFCPFPQCAGHGGWLQSTHLYRHIQREHLDAGQRVPEEWLVATGRKVCPGCRTLVTTASGRCKNPNCANPLGGYLAREAIARRAAGQAAAAPPQAPTASSSSSAPAPRSAAAPPSPTGAPSPAAPPSSSASGVSPPAAPPGAEPCPGPAPAQDPFLGLPPPGRLGGERVHTSLALPEPPGLKPSIREVMSTRRALYRHVPKGARAAFADALAKVLTDFTREPSWESLQALLALPKCALCVPSRGGKGRKAQNLRRTLGRIERFAQGDLLGLWEDGAPLPGKAAAARKRKRGCALSFEDKVARMEDDHFVGQIRALVEEGALSKAARHITSDGILDPHAEGVLDALRGLHPQAAAPDVSGVGSGEPISRDMSPEGTVKRVGKLTELIRSFPPG